MSMEKMLREHNIKVTPQRKAILTVLHDAKAVLSAQDLFCEVLKILPKTNFSTIYRNLDMLLSRGIICRITPEDSGDLFELKRQEGHHHHIICKSCGSSFAMKYCPMEAMEKELHKKGFTPTEHRFEIYGYCDKCQKNNTNEEVDH